MKTVANRGQGVLEYTLLLGVVIAVMVTVLLKEGGMKTAVANAYNNSSAAFTKSVNNLTVNAFR